MKRSIMDRRSGKSSSIPAQKHQDKLVQKDEFFTLETKNNEKNKKIIYIKEIKKTIIKDDIEKMKKKKNLSFEDDRENEKTKTC